MFENEILLSNGFMLPANLREPLRDGAVRYVICTAPRTGSWMLCTLLQRTRIAGSPTEYFGPSLYEEFTANRNLVHADDIREYFERAVARSTSENGSFGMKLTAQQTTIFVQQASDHRGLPYESLRDALETEFPSIRYLYLTRMNKVAQAISFYRALTDQVWQLRIDRPRPTKHVSYDHFAIQRCYQESIAADAYWEGFFAIHGIEPLRLTYEALEEDYEREMLRIEMYLGLSFSKPIAPPLTIKLAGEESAQWEIEFRHNGRIPEPHVMAPLQVGAPY